MAIKTITSTENISSFSELFMFHVDSLGLSTRVLCELTSLDEEVLSGWVSGKNPKRSDLYKVLPILGLDEKKSNDLLEAAGFARNADIVILAHRIGKKQIVEKYKLLRDVLADGIHEAVGVGPQNRQEPNGQRSLITKDQYNGFKEFVVLTIAPLIRNNRFPSIVKGIKEVLSDYPFPDDTLHLEALLGFLASLSKDEAGIDNNRRQWYPRKKMARRERKQQTLDDDATSINESLKIEGNLDPDQIASAFRLIIEEQESGYDGNPRRRPKRFRQIWEVFEGNETNEIALEKLANIFKGVKEEKSSAQNTISKMNAAFERRGLNIKISRVVNYKIQQD